MEVGTNMDMRAFGVDEGQRKTLVVLGAGASRGASFVLDRSRPLPPLDLDFFQQISRISSSDASRRLLEFVRSEYSDELSLSMERFFFRSRLHRSLPPQTFSRSRADHKEVPSST
jgi:hypothetical protein